MSQRVVNCPMGARCMGSGKHYENSAAYHECVNRGGSGGSGWGSGAGSKGSVMGDLSGTSSYVPNRFFSEINQDNSFASEKARRAAQENIPVDLVKPSLFERLTGRRSKANQAADRMRTERLHDNVMDQFARDHAGGGFGSNAPADVGWHRVDSGDKKKTELMKFVKPNSASRRFYETFGTPVVRGEDEVDEGSPFIVEGASSSGSFGSWGGFGSGEPSPGWDSDGQDSGSSSETSVYTADKVMSSVRNYQSNPDESNLNDAYGSVIRHYYGGPGSYSNYIPAGYQLGALPGKPFSDGAGGQVHDFGRVGWKDDTPEEIISSSLDFNFDSELSKKRVVDAFVKHQNSGSVGW